MKTIYFTDWLRKNDVSIHKFLECVKESLKYKTFKTLDKFLKKTEYEKDEFIDYSLTWDSVSWPHGKNKSYSFWSNLHYEWGDFIYKHSTYKIEFCKPDEIDNNFNYLKKTNKIKNKRIKKLKI